MLSDCQFTHFPACQRALSPESAKNLYSSYARALALVSALNSCHGSIKHTMLQLGLPRKTLYNKIKRHGLDKAAFTESWTHVSSHTFITR
ncbi:MULTISPECIES: helix-turn-helix domain-containing protein [Pseudomonadaceae]|uniref:DNA binding HTH domain-containing protein n=1 Tax=Ectopseudomonas oleovorans TaxID=301 RepID=A0A2T5PNY6_ECTOL|nr:helix-turn-helix domain-containing protein [Stutzerimonas nitrititolerans]PTU79434.1 hypothetical protein DBO86_08925 [Pseudomonas indoloxydans]